MVKKIWDLAISHNLLPFFPDPQLPTSVQDRLHDLYTAQSTSLTRIVILLWSIWKSLNAMVCNHEVSKPMGSQIRAKCDLT